ncbi:hypothetical protein CY34DRAFT_798322 [Suillus luteus UH-Slu-Lm8-n1]|uniref:Uncharacterized protein n=1 Tax=Suillus luteus UH-Slu-Lm8-n1 TaxID=930992 RepID=A0A0D0BRB2_9AGAM|nr:hypothetical protein CY34DRAFT_798322 [Suillus luteus UH-Slu-Lm8-n1]
MAWWPCSVYAHPSILMRPQVPAPQTGTCFEADPFDLRYSGECNLGIPRWEI